MSNALDGDCIFLDHRTKRYTVGAKRERELSIRNSIRDQHISCRYTNCPADVCSLDVREACCCHLWVVGLQVPSAGLFLYTAD